MLRKRPQGALFGDRFRKPANNRITPSGNLASRRPAPRRFDELVPAHVRLVRPLAPASSIRMRRRARLLGRFRVELEATSAESEQIHNHRGERTFSTGRASAMRSVVRPACSHALTITLAVAVIAAESCCSSTGLTAAKNLAKYASLYVSPDPIAFLSAFRIGSTTRYEASSASNAASRTLPITLTGAGVNARRDW